MRQMQIAAIAALTILGSIGALTNAAIGDDGRANCLFENSDRNFLHYADSTPSVSPNGLFERRHPYEPIEVALNESEAKDGEKKELTADDRIKELEDKLNKLDSSWSNFDDAEKKKKADAAKKSTFKIGGRIHLDYWDFINDSPGIGYFENRAGADMGQAPQDTLVFRRIRLEFQGDVPDNMQWRLQVDFNNPSSPEMKDVYLGFKELPGNQTLLIGNQKRPLGLDHLNSSRFNVFVERPLVIEAFSSDSRRPGICMYGISDDESINWRYGAFFLENISSDGRYLGDSLQMSLNGRLAGSPWYDESTDGCGYFHWAISGMAAKPDGGANSTLDGNVNEARFSTRPEARSQGRWLDTGAVPGAEWFEIIGLETILNVGPTQIVSEYQHTFVQRNGFSDTNFKGAYVYVSYFLTGEHIPYDRESAMLGRVKPFENFFLVDRHNCDEHGTGWGAWNVAARYSYLDVSDQDILGGVGHAGTAALNWHWNDHAKLQFDLTYGQITDHKNVGGYTSGDYTLCGTRFAIDF